MRKSCYSCVTKHLGASAVFIKETKMGYPDYDIYAIGELEHAADECLEENPDLALVIREHRIKWTDDRKHVIPFEALNRYIKLCVLAENSESECPYPSEDSMSGLDIEDGKISIHGDTRP